MTNIPSSINSFKPHASNAGWPPPRCSVVTSSNCCCENGGNLCRILFYIILGGTYTNSFNSVIHSLARSKSGELVDCPINMLERVDIQIQYKSSKGYRVPTDRPTGGSQYSSFNIIPARDQSPSKIQSTASSAPTNRSAGSREKEEKSPCRFTWLESVCLNGNQ